MSQISLKNNQFLFKPLSGNENIYFPLIFSWKLIDSHRNFSKLFHFIYVKKRPLFILNYIFVNYGGNEAFQCFSHNIDLADKVLSGYI